MKLRKEEILKYYSRKDIQDKIIEHSKNKEIAIKYDYGFGKRPDTLLYNNDILEAVKNKAISFHCSEELWKNPLQLSTDMKKKELESLRIGWDFILDIDCEHWQLAKITTWLLIKALKDFNIKSISLKFSGNKGFHIGIPFEAFPEKINNKKVKDLFPEGPRKMAEFLLDYISKNYIEVKENYIILGERFRVSFSKLMERTKERKEELTVRICSECGRIVEKKEEKTSFICPKCEKVIESDKEFVMCNKCKTLMEKVKINKTLCPCGSSSFIEKFNPLSIIKVDTLLISQRHLYRMPYSINEKSGLVSLPINPEEILEFKKKQARMEKVKTTYTFLDRKNVIKGEAKYLLQKALDFKKQEEEKKEEFKNIEISTKVSEEFFPPCIKNILKGLSDGRKRAVFILLNFLTSLGWNYEEIEELLKKWNKRNEEPLRENYIQSQLRYHKKNKKKILPPNCNNNLYYSDIGVCKPKDFCKKIKNPVNYAILKKRMRKGNKTKTI